MPAPVADRIAITLTPPLSSDLQDPTLRDLRALHDTLCRDLDHARRAGLPGQRDLRARLAACAADLMEAQFDNLPV